MNSLDRAGKASSGDGVCILQYAGVGDLPLSSARMKTFTLCEARWYPYDYHESLGGGIRPLSESLLPSYR